MRGKLNCSAAPSNERTIYAVTPGRMQGVSTAQLSPLNDKRNVRKTLSAPASSIAVLPCGDRLYHR
jgi:hypothetical protein